MLFTELLSKWCYYMKVEFWRVLRSGPRCNSHHPPVHCRLRSFMMECWTTRLNDEWWVWVNYMSEKYRYVSQTSLLSMSDTGRLPTHTHTHSACQCCIQGIRLTQPPPKCCYSNRWCLKVTQVRLLLADVQYKRNKPEWWLCLRLLKPRGGGGGWLQQRVFNWTPRRMIPAVRSRL